MLKRALLLFSPLALALTIGATAAQERGQQGAAPPPASLQEQAQEPAPEAGKSKEKKKKSKAGYRNNRCGEKHQDAEQTSTEAA